MVTLGEKYNISKDISISDIQKNEPAVVKKAVIHHDDIISFLDSANNFVSQFDWLEYCVANGYY